ncbi:hypothetical protein MMC22_006981 [Lobaria immixta]|nr:hypothetical protein [Lobaria immixta]
MAKSSGTAAHFSVADGRGSNSSTPRRRSAAKKSGNGVKKSGGAKKKRAAKDVDSSDSDDTDAEQVTSPSQKTKRGAAAAKAVTFSNPIVIKAETNGEDAMIASNDSTPDDEVNETTAEI